jgi:hypothetical protein
LYKCNIEGGPAGYWGDWASMVFHKDRESEWGGSYSTASAEVSNHLDDVVAAGDVVVAYQTNLRAVVGFCRITKVTGPAGDRKVFLRPIEALDPPWPIHDAKRGTVLERSAAVNGPVMLRELSRDEMEAVVRLSGAPRRVMRGQTAAGGYKPPKNRTRGSQRWP